MDLNHISDETLQKISEGKLQPDKIASRHLQNCAQCRAALSTYRELVTELRNEEGFLLSADFADRVIQKSGLGKKRSSDFIDTVLLIASICSGLAVTGYYLFKSAFFEAIGNIIRLPRIDWHSMPASGISQNALMLIFALIILLIFGLMDRFLRPGSPPRTR